MKKWREAIGNAIDAGVWSVEIGRSTSKERDILAVTVDNACTIHCAKQSHVLRHFSYYFFSKCTSSVTGTTWRKLEQLDLSSHACIAFLRICIDTRSLLFVHTLANSHILHPVGKLTVYPFTPFSWILNKDHDLYTCEPQVNEILHMFSIHKMACIASLDIMSHI